MITENKKVKNATRCEYNGITFKSTLEMDVYKLFEAAGIELSYEPVTYTLRDSKYCGIKHYAPYRDRRSHKMVWGVYPYKILSIKYTPDFITNVNGRCIVIECKGFCTERYTYQKKLFLEFMESNYPEGLFFEVHTLRQAKKALEIIQTLDD